MKLSAFIAVSLDGFIARANGGIDWLNEANATIPKGEDCGFGDFFQSIDAILIGRKTYEQVLEFKNWHYGEKKVVILSRSEIEFPDFVPRESVTRSADQPSELCKMLKTTSNHVYVDGGITIQSFLQAGLLDNLTITHIPLLLGEGIPLFGSLAQEIPLKCESSKLYPFENGLLQSKWTIQK